MTPTFARHSHPKLSKAEEVEMFERWYAARDYGQTRRADRILQDIIVQFTPIIGKLVRRMKGYNLDYDDLYSEGLAGLVYAAKRFDISKGYRFGTYASTCVLNSLYTFISKDFFMVNICSNNRQKKIFFGLRREQARLLKGSDSYELTNEVVEKLAKRIEVTPEEIRAMAVLLNEPYASLQYVITDGDEGATRQDALSQEEVNGTIGVEELLASDTTAEYRQNILFDSLDILDDRTKDIIINQDLRREDETMTLEELGDVHGVSKERIRQVRNKGYTKIKAHMAAAMRKDKLAAADLFD